MEKQTQLLTELTDSELEAGWQAQCSYIQITLTEMYAETDSKKQADLRVLAECAQTKQSEIQREITRRH